MKKAEMSSRPKSGNKLVAFAALLVLVTGATSVLAFTLYKENQDLKNDPVLKKVKQIEQKKDVRKKLEKLMYIPKDTKAFIGTYKENSELKKNPFFKDAKDGDQYFIFSELGKAVIYRESENKIINSGPITINDAKKDEPKQQQQPQQQQVQ